MKVATLRAALENAPDHADVWCRRFKEPDGVYADHVVYKQIYDGDNTEDSSNVRVIWVLEIVTE